MTHRDTKEAQDEAPVEVEATVEAPGAAKGEPETEAGKKERVLHTRVPAVLEQELKRLADNIRVPVSNLVRTILEDAVEMADRAGRGVEAELHRAATSLHEKRETVLRRREKSAEKGAEKPAAKQGLDAVIGFQPLTLAGDAGCACCDKRLAAGDDAHLGVSADPTAPRVVVCNDCVPRPRGKT